MPRTSRRYLAFAVALLAAAASARAGAQADWSDLQPTTIDGLKVATKCLQKSPGPVPSCIGSTVNVGQ